MITSSQNPKIQWVRALQSRPRQRREHEAFVVEGVRLAEEALSAGWQAQLVLYTDELSERGLQVVERFSAQGVPVEQAAPQALRAASDTQTPQGLLVVLAMRRLPTPEKIDFVLIPDAVRDPGNLGTILRSAAAAGVDAVFLPPGSAGPFSPKVVRAAMGAHFRLPVWQVSWEEIQVQVQAAGLRVYLAAAGGGEDYTQCNFRTPLALIVGGEAEGPGQEAQRLAAARVHIPMSGGVESLNAAAAAAILLFEVVRQRHS
jgi:TrmH family RNA methyltransferase